MNSDVMVGFGGKQAWLAVRDGDPAEILAALGLRDLGEVPWRDGIDLAHLTDDRVAVTPPLPGARGAGWVLAAGRYLMRPGTVLDLTDLSGRLHTEVQFFATHRVTEAHRWQRADDGALVRAFGYVGRTGAVTTWYGDPDPAERAAGLPPTFRAPGLPLDEAGGGPLDEAMLGSLDEELTRLLRGEAVGGNAEGSTVLVSEQDVLRVADGWSLDPTRLDGREAPGPLRLGAAA
ncbi:hypothetical protein [Couchioplanes azureus]|uniref:hypothetical protein n=1 Tax=Couchioplanes caeruleus TaxID=56438 RepID=UPI0016711129|nr:hypothetical protein [Couchioplanes caeruleus]GGQ88039.1 hypothetical protein GCM10010166_67700 [Couchioplanes caeruleus subsp. azureus]